MRTSLPRFITRKDLSAGEFSSPIFGISFSEAVLILGPSGAAVYTWSKRRRGKEFGLFWQKDTLIFVLIFFNPHSRFESEGASEIQWKYTDITSGKKSVVLYWPEFKEFSLILTLTDSYLKCFCGLNFEISWVFRRAIQAFALPFFWQVSFFRGYWNHPRHAVSVMCCSLIALCSFIRLSVRSTTGLAVPPLTVLTKLVID